MIILYNMSINVLTGWICWTMDMVCGIPAIGRVWATEPTGIVLCCMPKVMPIKYYILTLNCQKYGNELSESTSTIKKTFSFRRFKKRANLLLLRDLDEVSR